MLALHGTPGSRLMFAVAHKAARERKVRLIAPERPGYGLSDYRRVESLAQIAEDLGAVADAYGLGRFAVMGVSGGAPYAVAAAEAMPDRISLLALVAPLGEVADGRLRLSRFHRFVFKGFARRPWATRIFFHRLRTMVFKSPDTAYRWMMRRARPADRAVLARSEVRASLQAGIGEGLRPGIEGAAQDLRLYCAPWRLTACRDRRASHRLARERRSGGPAGGCLRPGTVAAQLPIGRGSGRRTLLGVRPVRADP